MHHWSGWTETATENGAGSRRHCSSHSSVASSIAADQWYVFWIPLLQYFSHAVIIGFKSGEFAGHSWGGINSGVSLSNNSIVARTQWGFQVSQGTVETLFRWGGTWLYRKFIKEAPNFVTIARVLFIYLHSHTKCLHNKTCMQDNKATLAALTGVLYI